MTESSVLERASMLDHDVVAPLIEAFVAIYGEEPMWIVRAPGRVNLIGDHTDYNNGFVLPMAIDRAVWIALRPRQDDIVHAHSINFAEPAEFSVSSLVTPTPGGAVHDDDGWSAYVTGVAWSMREAGFQLRGWDGVVTGDVPLGAGLSSSAALEMATARAFAITSGLPWDATAMATIAQRAENLWVGVQCGVMDQLISAAGVAGHALCIDCLTLGTQPVPIPSNVAVVVLDTATRRGLVDSEYNSRRAQCRVAASFFGVLALRDVTLRMFESRAAMLHPIVRDRARHVITENARVLAAAEALEHHNVGAFGKLMNESHASLRDDFEVSSKELDIMVSIAQEHSGCYGARMTGAGFGGCAVAVIDAATADDFIATVTERYTAQTGLIPSITRCIPSAGAQAEHTPKT